MFESLNRLYCYQTILQSRGKQYCHFHLCHYEEQIQVRCSSTIHIARITHFSSEIYKFDKIYILIQRLLNFTAYYTI